MPYSGLTRQSSIYPEKGDRNPIRGFEGITRFEGKEDYATESIGGLARGFEER